LISLLSDIILFTQLKICNKAKNQKLKGKGETLKTMENSRMEEVKDILIKENPTFKELVNQHQSYEKRLIELADLSYPSEEELQEETTLKRKKLVIKDEMYNMMNEYCNSH